MLVKIAILSHGLIHNTKVILSRINNTQTNTARQGLSLGVAGAATERPLERVAPERVRGRL